MKKIILILLFITSLCTAQVKLYVALPTSVQAEADCFNSFKIGYESVGGHWTGTVKLDSFVTGSEINSYVLPYCQSNGYNLIIRPAGVSGYTRQSVDSFYMQGIQIITCGGSNSYHSLFNQLPLRNYIQCGGSNLADTANMTSYYIEFFGKDPFGFASQSYGHAYVAGQMAFIKDSLERRDNITYSWWNIRNRCRMTGSKNGIFTQFDGYGKINILSAINYNGVISADPFDSLGTTANINVDQNYNIFTIQINAVWGALNYSIFDNDILIQTITDPSTIIYTSNKLYKSGGGIHNFYYIAYRYNNFTVSNVVSKRWFIYPKIYVKNNN